MPIIFYIKIYMLSMTFYDLLAASVFFSQLTYDVDEGDGQVQPMLILSNPTSFNVIIEVMVSERNSTATASEPTYVQ